MTKKNKTPKEFMELSKDTNWMPCLVCGDKIIQVRKAFFKCEKCGTTFIAEEGDMRDNGN